MEARVSGVLHPYPHFETLKSEGKSEGMDEGMRTVLISGIPPFGGHLAHRGHAPVG